MSDDRSKYPLETGSLPPVAGYSFARRRGQQAGATISYQRRLVARRRPIMLRPMQQYDAVLVPGGGLRPDGSLPPFVLSRLGAAQALAGEAPVIPLSAHTVHRAPPVNAAGYPVLESVAAAEALLARGVPAARIWAETASLDTIGNAYFARVIHTDPAGLRRLLVVNSEFHMPRTRMIFDWIFGLPPADPPYSLEYHTVPDQGLTEIGLEARRAKEAARMEDLRRTIPRVDSLAALHRFLFTEHRAYAAGADPQSDAPPAAALESY